MSAVSIHQAFELALQHHQCGRLPEAEGIYRQILGVQADHAGALHYLGVIAQQVGRLEEAAKLIERAVEIAPGDAAAHSNLGEVYRAMGRMEMAVAHYRRALELKADSPEAWSNLGNALREQGKREEAMAAYREALKLRPDFAQAHNNLGVVLGDLGRREEAIAEYRRALELRPENPEAETNLGIALSGVGRVEEAMAAYRRALTIQPRHAQAHNSLGLAHAGLGRWEAAIADYQRAVQCEPGFAEAWSNLGGAWRDRGELDEAVACFQRVIQIRPAWADGYNQLGNVFKDQGRLDDAVVALRRAVELRPEDAVIHSNLVHTLHFLPGDDDRLVVEEERRWEASFGREAMEGFLSYANERNPERRLRIGYVSADFRDHVIGRNLMPLFRHHDLTNFEIWGYSGVEKADGFTEEFRKRSTGWREVADLTDAELADRVRDDGIDVLVDLSQHLAGNRLPVFARRPAPVQVSFAGYPAGTGLEAIGYRFGDRWMEAEAPEGVYLLDSFWCYDPCGLEVEVNALPATENGWVTFGSLNNFCKVNEVVLKLWARVLKAVPDSRLVMLAGLGSHRQRTLGLLAAEGIEARRVEFVPRCSREDYLRCYRRVDVVLDSFPYNGHTTSLDALYMGVPVVSRAGQRVMSRAGLSQMSNLGLEEFVAFSDEDFVRIAVGLATDEARLAGLRGSLRERMKASVLMDGGRFAREIEGGYRAMWGQWCAGAA